MFHAKTPRFAIVWLRDFHNAWHSGQTQTVVEKMRKIKPLDAQWAAHCKLRGWTARSCGTKENSYRHRNWTFIAEHSPRTFPSMNVFESYRAIVNFATSKQCLDSILSLIDGITMYDDSRLSDNVFMELAHKWMLLLHPYQLPRDLFLVTYLEGIKFMLPSVQAPVHLPGIEVFTSGRGVDMLFEKGEDSKFLQWLSLPMKSSVLYANDAGSLPKKRPTSASNPSQPKKKAKKGAGAGAVPDEQARAQSAEQLKAADAAVSTPKTGHAVSVKSDMSEMAMLQGLEADAEAEAEAHPSDVTQKAAAATSKSIPAATSMESSREWTFLDDAFHRLMTMLKVFNLAIDDWNYPPQDTALPLPKYKALLGLRQQVAAWYISVSLEFAWRKTMTIDNKQYKTWSTFMPAALDLCAATLAEGKTAIMTAAEDGEARSWGSGLEANQNQNAGGDGDHGRHGHGGGSTKDDDEKTSNLAWTRSLLAACQDGGGSGSGEALSSSNAEAKAGEREEDAFRRLLKECGREAQASISSTSGKPLKLHPTFQALQADFLQVIGKPGELATHTYQTFLSLAMTIINKHVPESWLRLAALSSKLAPTDPTCKLTCGDVDVCASFLGI